MTVLVLALGNDLCGDDGFGAAVLRQLGEMPGAALMDGGTAGLVLVAAIAEAQALVVVDAGHFGGAPGTLRTFVGSAMDQAVGRRGASAHGIGLADLMAAASLAGMLPERRALVTAEPAGLEWGAALSPAVAARLGEAAAEVGRLVGLWRAGD